MSMQALEQFYQKVQGSDALEAEATAALQHGPAAIIALGAREGFDFSEDELSAGLDQLTDKGELSDQDLDLVAGGIPPRPSLKDSTYGKIIR